MTNMGVTANARSTSWVAVATSVPRVPTVSGPKVAKLVIVTVLGLLTTSATQPQAIVNVARTPTAVNVTSVERASGISLTVNVVTATAMPTFAILRPALVSTAKTILKHIIATSVSKGTTEIRA